MRKMIRKIVAGLAGMAVIFPAGAGAQPEKARPGNANEKQNLKAGFSKEELINALQQMKRNPQEIKAVCAMCYKTVMPSPEVEFSCDHCHKVSLFSRQSIEGNLAESLPMIKRSLAQMPYEVKIDSIGLCPVCGAGHDKVLRMNVNCFNCGKGFSWEVKTFEDIRALHWLYLKPPFKEIDGNELGIWGTDNQDKIREGSEYIRSHVFCPECRNKIKLDKE